MVQRPVGRVLDAFQTCSASRVPRRPLFSGATVDERAAGIMFGYVETIQLPEKINWRTFFRSCPRVTTGLSPACVLFVALLTSPTQMLRRLWELTQETAKTLAVSSWVDSSAAAAAAFCFVKNVNRCCCRGNNKNHNNDIDVAVPLQRHRFFSRHRRLLTAVGFDSVAMCVSRRYLAGDGPVQKQPKQDECFAQDDMVVSYTGMDDEWTTLQLSKARWYARQVQRSLVDSECVRRLCQDTHMRTEHRRVAMALGCIYASNSSSNSDGGGGVSVTDVLLCLPIADRAATVAALLRFFSHYAVSSDRLHEALATVLNDRHITNKEAWVLLQAMMAVSDVSSIVQLWGITEVVRHVVLGEGDGSVVHRERTMTALRFGECVLTTEALAALCEESGLWYESAAYYLFASGVLLEVTEKGKKSNRCGFGEEMVVLLRAVRTDDYAAASSSSSSSPIGIIEALRKEMPPVVATYTMHRVAAELTRNEWENEYDASNREGSGNMGIRSGSNMTALQYLRNAVPLSDDAVGAQAFRLHFDMRLGSLSTSSALLPSCRHDWHRTVRLMQHTHHAGVTHALDALWELMELAPFGRYYVILRLQASQYRFCGANQSCTLLLEAKATAEALGASEGFEALSAGPWRYLAEAAARHHPHVGQALWSLPVSYIPRVAAAMPQLPSSVLSCWIRLLLRHRRYDSVDVVLQIASERGVVPEMMALVEVLESVYDFDRDAAQLQRAVRSVRSLFPDCAPAVFRAFVERTAAKMHDKTLHSWSTGLKLLSTVSVLGLLHYPRSCLESIAACAPTPVVYAMLQILSEDGDAAAVEGDGGAAVPCSSPAPLELGALRRLLRSAQMAGLRPEVDVVAVSCATKKTAWWSSDTAVAGVSMATALYKMQAVGLWRHALQEVSWMKMSCVDGAARCDGVAFHHAVRLASFGSDSVATLRRGVLAAEERGRKKVGLVESGRARRLTRVDDAMLISTLACVAGALVARGRWESALRIIPLGVTDLPPLLRLARLKALQCSSDFDVHAAMLLEPEQRPRRNKWRKCQHVSCRPAFRRRRCGMPAGVRRIVKKMQMSEMFRWWDKRS
ncbi:TPR-repeat-containing chaperone protein DNAJ, putative [Trypanosoma cruzi marinkellei]|uniref:TPR-repeat-containing chaperone protein DNAJ, putative n=1 Tax=Trypanosoma cruzi marinkellei TaxID=85056 RepID=K2LYV8_TRYCR|nr:TPR-repeat-containing chaperone protein DNAJ, putative [Trypanosoma cruzi marinkellei]